MAYDFKAVHIRGRLGGDPESRETQGGTSLCTFSLGSNPGKKDDPTLWLPVKAFGQTADTVLHYCTKGSPVIVSGRLTQEEWQDKNTGDKRSKIVLVASSVNLLPDPRREERADRDDHPPARTPARSTPRRVAGSSDLPDDYEVPF